MRDESALIKVRSVRGRLTQLNLIIPLTPALTMKPEVCLRCNCFLIFGQHSVNGAIQPLMEPLHSVIILGMTHRSGLNSLHGLTLEDKVQAPVTLRKTKTYYT